MVSGPKGAYASHFINAPVSPVLPRKSWVACTSHAHLTLRRHREAVMRPETIKVLRSCLFGPIDLRRTSSQVPESSRSQRQLLKVLLFG